MKAQQQEEGHSQEATPSAAAEGHQEVQFPFGNMALTMEHNFQDNLGQGMMFGDDGSFSFDPAAFGLSTPDHPNPVLNQNDEALLTQFFKDPHGTTSNLVPFDTGVPQNHTVNGGYGYDHMNAPQSSIHFKTEGNGSASYDHSEAWANRPHHMNADDYNAANTIHHLRATPTPQHTADFQFPSGISASWGNFALLTPSPNTQISSGIPHPAHPHQQHLQALPLQTRNPSFNYSNQLAMAHNTMTMPQHQPPASRSRHLSTPQAGQWPNSQLPPNYGPPGPFTYGSDQSFNGERFQSTARHPEDKGGNLLNVPLADQASHRQRNNSMADQQRNGHRGSLNGTSSSQPAQFGSMRAPTGPNDNFPAPEPKRQLGREDGADMSPKAAASKRRAEESDDESNEAAKRRKSTATALQAPESPDEATLDGASKRRKAKARETLTDAEKRKHHIESEKKRREIINKGFNDLQNMVPVLKQGKSGLSRSEVLQEIGSYLQSLKQGNEQLQSYLLRDHGINTAQGGPPDSAPPIIKTEEGAGNS